MYKQKKRQELEDPCLHVCCFTWVKVKNTHQAENTHRSLLKKGRSGILTHFVFVCYEVDYYFGSTVFNTWGL